MYLENKPIINELNLHGRLPPLNQESTNKLKEHYKHDFMTNKTKVDAETFKNNVVQQLKEQNKLTRLDPIPLLSKQQWNRIRKEVLPVINKNPTITNVRREQALNDPLNSIANAVVCIAQFNPTIEEPNGENKEPTLRLSMDMASIQIGLAAKDKPVYIPQGSTAAMKALGRSASRQCIEEETMTRTVKILCCCLGDGTMCTVYHIVKDSNFKKWCVVDYLFRFFNSKL